MRVVVIGAGLGGLSAAAHLSNRGHHITIVERDATPGGRAGMVVSDGFRLDNGPTVLTMPNLLADAFNAAGADMADFVTIRPVDPMYRAVYARRIDAVRPTRPRGDDRGDPPVRERPRSRGVRAVLRLVATALQGGDGIVHRRQLRLAARPVEAVARRARTDQARRIRQPGQEGRVVLRRRTPAADLQLPVDVRRAGARTRRWRSTPSSPTWIPSRACSSPRAACT